MSSHDNTKPLAVGDRVRLDSQQYTNAYAFGTATVVEVLKQHRVDGTWEYLVHTDRGQVRSWNIVDTPDPLLASLLPYPPPQVTPVPPPANRVAPGTG